MPSRCSARCPRKTHTEQGEHRETRTDCKGEKSMVSRRKIAIVTVGVSIAMIMGVAASAGASLKPGTTLTGTSKHVVFKGSIDGVSITVTCTGFKDSGTVKS